MPKRKHSKATRLKMSQAQKRRWEVHRQEARKERLQKYPPLFNSSLADANKAQALFNQINSTLLDFKPMKVNDLSKTTSSSLLSSLINKVKGWVGL